jgi:hypothetical protein
MSAALVSTLQAYKHSNDIQPVKDCEKELPIPLSLAKQQNAQTNEKDQEEQHHDALVDPTSLALLGTTRSPILALFDDIKSKLSQGVKEQNGSFHAGIQSLLASYFQEGHRYTRARRRDRTDIDTLMTP